MKDTYCPKCNTHLILNQQTESSRTLKCPNCKSVFNNPHSKNEDTLGDWFSQLSRIQKLGVVSFGVLFLFVLIGYLSEYRTYERSNPLPISSHQTENTIYTYRSGFYDWERDNQSITRNEVTYHKFDFEQKTVTQTSTLNGETVTLVYPFQSMYLEEGLAATTYVLRVNTLGCKEIWWSPDVPNLGYDYDDGTRIACYNLTLVSQ